jgi:hypothetical protein
MVWAEPDLKKAFESIDSASYMEWHREDRKNAWFVPEVGK